MKSVLLYIALAIFAIVSIILIIAAFKPKDYSFERSITSSAASSEIYAVLIDLHRFPEWSPWQKRDPALKAEFKGPATGVGSSFSWDGNDEVGAGTMTIVGVEAEKQVDIRLDFLRPFKDTSKTLWRVEDEGAQRRIIWSMQGERALLSRVVCLFIDLDGMIGKDFSDGLTTLKGILER